jgi:hypothetical protein
MERLPCHVFDALLGHKPETKVMKIIFTFLGAVLLFVPLFAQEGTKGWNFDSDKIGANARGFMNESGEWKVLTDSTAPSQPNVLAQVAKNSGSAFNVALVGGAMYKDVELSVKMKAINGKEDQGGGLIWRAKDSKNYYVARFNPLEDNYRLYKVDKGKRTLLKSADVKHSDGWHTLTIAMKEDLVQCYYDGKKVLEAKDSTFQGPGRIGLWTKADAQTYFDDLAVSEK